MSRRSKWPLGFLAGAVLISLPLLTKAGRALDDLTLIILRVLAASCLVLTVLSAFIGDQIDRHQPREEKPPPPRPPWQFKLKALVLLSIAVSLAAAFFSYPRRDQEPVLFYLLLGLIFAFTILLLVLVYREK